MRLSKIIEYICLFFSLPTSEAPNRQIHSLKGYNPLFPYALFFSDILSFLKTNI